ncbi:MAG: lysine transporter LysE [Desulfuromonas sp.]|nr:LysE family transporter [Desulfuromonas sp.]PLX84723.1 MAG: lysine transporter LysE [Desulfuromonas sp.]
MNLMTIAGMSFLLGLSGAMMPGPLLTVTVTETVRRGMWAGPLLMAGHALLEGALVLLLFFGLADLVQDGSAFSVIALAGGGMLLWMGYGMLRSLPTLRLELVGEEGSGLHPLAAGAVVSLANPYFTLWWATVGMGYLAVAHKAGPAGVAVFYLFHILADFVWYTFVAGTVSFGRRFLSDRGYRILV